MQEEASSPKPRLRRLSVQDHSRDSAGLTYVYPVVSRRAGGVSVGINLNPNNACNWQCMYCQVPGLTLGKAPPIDHSVLERELRGFLEQVLYGDYLQTKVPKEARVLKDLALSGNGEPTSAKDFDLIVDKIGKVMQDFELVGKIPLVLISNGSLADKPSVQRGLARLGELGGECWYKLDSVWPKRRLEINKARQGLDVVASHLATVGERCRLRLQCCLFELDGESPSDAEIEDYGRFVRHQLEAGTKIQDILLYGLARPSMQPGAHRLAALDQSRMQGYAQTLRELSGLPVKLSV